MQFCYIGPINLNCWMWCHRIWQFSAWELRILWLNIHQFRNLPLCVAIWEWHTGCLNPVVWYKTCEQILLAEAHVESWNISFVVTFKIGVAQVLGSLFFHTDLQLKNCTCYQLCSLLFRTTLFMVLFHSASQVESTTSNSCITLCSIVDQCIACSMRVGETALDLLC